ncbi:MAG: DUF2851 family protein [Calditrichaeota bacterium]|nr:MAG: DUF2851 family protein [Calditrichota bacterium]
MELKVHDQELLLQQLWKSGQLFRAPLTTVTGQSVEVLYAGRENLDAGPDFKDAVLKIDGRLVRGDVEVHLDANGWYAHGHHTDPAYNRVVLHLVSDCLPESKFVEREDSVAVPQVKVDLSANRAGYWPKQTERPGQEQDRVACPLSQTTVNKIHATIHRAAEQRFAQKAAQMHELLADLSWNGLLYVKIAEALGYAKNQVPFRRLVTLVPYEELIQEMQWVSEEMAERKAAALLFGAAGLLPSQATPAMKITDSETLDYVAPLEVLWQEIAHRRPELKPMKAHDWQFFRLRPQNFPTRRIAGLVGLLRRFYQQGFLESFGAILKARQRNARGVASEMETALVVQSDGFWRNRFTFDKALDTGIKAGAPALIGKQRARDIAVNIILPALYVFGDETGDGRLKNTVKELLGRYPRRAENGITRGMKKQLGATFPGVEKGMSRSALEQQGLIQLHKFYCVPGKCNECLTLAS